MYNTNNGPEEYRINSFDDNVDFSNINAELNALDNYNSNFDKVGNTYKIATNLFSEPKIARLNYNIEVENFFDKPSVKRREYYVIGDLVGLEELTSNDNSYTIEILNKYQYLNLSNNDTIFLFDDAEDVKRYTEIVFNLKLNQEHYNFMWTTIPDGIDTNKLNDNTFPKLTKTNGSIIDELLITKEDMIKDYDNVFIQFEQGDLIFDFAYKRCINVISAQSGNLKSTFVNNLVGALSSNENDLGFTFLDDEKKDGQIVIIDTETNSQKLVQQFEHYTNFSNKVMYFTLKNISKAKRFEEFIGIINEIHDKGLTIRTIILDSLKDFIVDFNNIKDSDLLIERIVSLAEMLDIPIITTYQENLASFKGATSKLTGHLGTMLHQKAETLYKTIAKGDKAEIKCLKSRSEINFTLDYSIESPGNFVDLKIIGQKGNKKTSHEKKMDKLVSNIDQLFAQKKELTHDEVLNWIMPQIDVKARAAAKWKKELIDADVIKKKDETSSKILWIRV